MHYRILKLRDVRHGSGCIAVERLSTLDYVGEGVGSLSSSPFAV